MMYRHWNLIYVMMGPPSALDIAKTQLAKGEMTPEEYVAM